MIGTRRQIEMVDSWEDTDALEGAEEKPRIPREIALDVVRDLMPHLVPYCLPVHFKVCGSLRRMKSTVGDVELVFVPKLRCVKPETRDLFGVVVSPAQYSADTCQALDALVAAGILAKRLKSNGTPTWGQWNRLAVHVASGVPVDFFACEKAAWWNTVVSRTGGAHSNTAIAGAALKKGWHWQPSPTAVGFWRSSGLGQEVHAVHSEEDVFAFVDLPYRKPEDRT